MSSSVGGNVSIVNRISAPLVFINYLQHWKDVPCSLDEVVQKYGNISLNFQVSPEKSKDIAWENDAHYIAATISQFSDWLSSGNDPSPVENPLIHYKSDEYWAYSGYNYMNQVFSEDSDIMKMVNWDLLGLNEISGNDGVFWIGNKGAYTQCHLDTYGCNLVAQVLGRKKWILFPPDDIPYMYPTRIPYEESSIFSSVNILHPDLSEHPHFKKSHPHVVVLKPGDVLFVPKRWWHFVTCLETSVSINTWIKLDSDKERRLEESVTKALINSLVPTYEPENESWLNPGESLESVDKILSYITSSLEECNSFNPEAEPGKDKSVTVKIAKISEKSDVYHEMLGKCISNVISAENMKKINPSTFDECFGSQFSASVSQSKVNVDRKKIMSCFIHPDVISLICEKLKNMSNESD